MDSHSSSVSPTLCPRGCGFYGTPDKNNMCSKCYRDFLKQGIIAKTNSADDKLAPSSSMVDATPSPTMAKAKDKVADSIALDMPIVALHSLSIETETCVDSIKTETCVDNKGKEDDKTATISIAAPVVKKNRCENCNKKVGLTGFLCRCGKMFCGSHRYPKEHSCTFDFKKADLDRLVKQNPLIKADKIDYRV